MNSAMRARIKHAKKNTKIGKSISIRRKYKHLAGK
jgi:hypothetical protein